MQKNALITGITGQDGAYLACLLLEKGYRVWGTCRRGNSNPWRLKSLDILNAVELVEIDLTDATQTDSLLNRLKPRELYHMAAHSSVAESFQNPLASRWNGTVTLQLLEGVRQHTPLTRFFHASSAEMFGISSLAQLTEETAFAPVSPYACSKVFGHHLVSVFRNSFGIYACSGILFNHESPLRTEQFVTRKIAKGLAAQMTSPQPEPLRLGNLEAQRDWGYAPDYVRAMWKMLQIERPVDLILSTGTCYSVKEFVEFCAHACNINLGWEVRDGALLGFNRSTGRIAVVSDPALRRPTDIPRLCGLPAKAAQYLGWSASTRLPQLAELLVQSELSQLTPLP